MICAGCGKTIHEGEPRYKRLMLSGFSEGPWVSRRSYGFSARAYQRFQWCCASCASTVDRNTAAQSSFIVTTLLVGIGLVVALIVGFSIAQNYLLR
jgi:hypothetical protein